MRGTRALALAGASLFFPIAALAPDLPVKAPVIPQAVYNWTGFYAGVNAGYGGGMKDWGGINEVAKGGLAGVQFGFNQQVGNLVFGLEGDASWSGMKGSQDEFIAIPFSVSSFSATIGSKIKSVETLAAR